MFKAIWEIEWDNEASLKLCIVALHHSGRRSRVRGLPGRLGYSLMRGEEGMSTAEMRALPVVIHERHSGHHHVFDRAGITADDEHVSSDSDDGIPRGAKGGGTLKTCAICIEDYR